MVTFSNAQEVAEVLVERVSPVAVIVFGSVARTGQGNDLDILVVTHQENMTEKVGVAIREFFERFAIDFFVTSTSALTRSFMKGSPFLRLIQREGKVVYMEEAYRDWNRLAQEDLEQSEYLMEGGYYRGACFNAQQAIEKAIKGELLRRGWELERVHVIRRLLAIANEYDLDLEYKEADIDFIDSIYRSRYPAEEGLLPFNEPTMEDARRAIGIARGLFEQLTTGH